jgi:hypothetical protein
MLLNESPKQADRGQCPTPSLSLSGSWSLLAGVAGWARRRRLESGGDLLGLGQEIERLS